MRRPFYARLLFPLVGLLAIGVWVACGESGPADIPGPDGGADTGDTNDTDTGTPFSPPDSGGTPVPDTGAPETSGPAPFDAGPYIFLDAGPDFDGGIQCFEGGEVEEEPNDDKDHANVLRPIRCGQITVPPSGGPDGGESDWLTFQVQDASTGFRLYYEGQVHVFVETDGMAPTDISLPDQHLDFIKDAPYYVQIRSNDGGTQFWRLVLREESVK
jgi:hypothetical protein